MVNRLPYSFFARDTIVVAKDLLGKRLVREINGQRISGIITETEAYRGEEDLACHARSGLTKRTEVMFGPAGHAYIYFIYGMHWLLNFVTEEEGFPGAVLIRAIHPEEGLQTIAKRRNGQPHKMWTNGPAKICQALDIDGELNGLDVCDPNTPLYLELGENVNPHVIESSPRVGLNSVPEPWKTIAWRFVVNYQDLMLLAD
jgi:DNA-3-methyladenine glycosylase